MMRNERKDYKDCSEWLSALKEDDAWKSQKAQLMAPNANISELYRDAIKMMEKSYVVQYWKIYQHNVASVVQEVWQMAELSLPMMKYHTLGMLTLEWIEQHHELEKACGAPASDGDSAQEENGNASSIDSRDPKSILPPRLKSPEAMEYWHELQKEGYLDENYKPTKKTTRGQLWFIAQLFCQKMDMSMSWDPFEVLFNKRRLAQEGSKFNIFGKQKLHCKRIEHIFGITLKR